MWCLSRTLLTLGVQCVNELIKSVGYLTARENEVELFTTKLYDLHIVSVKKFHKKTVCHKFEGVQLRFVQI